MGNAMATHADGHELASGTSPQTKSCPLRPMPSHKTIPFYHFLAKWCVLILTLQSGRLATLIKLGDHSICWLPSWSAIMLQLLAKIY